MIVNPRTRQQALNLVATTFKDHVACGGHFGSHNQVRIMDVSPVGFSSC